MPHQCLKCGNVFPNNSPEILKGCSRCGGTRFFFTEVPVSDEERTKLTEQTEKEMEAFVMSIVNQKIDSDDLRSESEWIKLVPKSVKELESDFEEAEEKVVKARRVKVEKEEKRPEVVRVIERGVYDIDVKSLLENSPVIVQKDGSYLIHLPSVFEKVAWRGMKEKALSQKFI